MRIGLALYHANLYKVYKEYWVKKCMNTLLQQTYQENLTFCELIYGGEDDPTALIYKYKLPGKDNQLHISPRNNHAEALNFCFDRLVDSSCDYLFNVHLDDYYALDRIERQLEYLKKGYELVSSDVVYIEQIPDLQQRADQRYIFQPPVFSMYNDLIHKEFKQNHNVIANPVVAMTAKFWLRNRPYDPNLIPNEDFDLYKRGLKSPCNYYIIPQILLYYRRHDKQVCQVSKAT